MAVYYYNQVVGLSASIKSKLLSANNVATDIGNIASDILKTEKGDSIQTVKKSSSDLKNISNDIVAIINKISTYCDNNCTVAYNVDQATRKRENMKDDR